MLMDLLPTIAKVYSFLVQQERQLILPLDESKTLAASVNGFSYIQPSGRGQSSRVRGYRGGRTTVGRGRGIRLCSHCGKIGHAIDTCWKKRGVFPHFQQTGMMSRKTKLLRY